MFCNQWSHFSLLIFRQEIPVLAIPDQAHLSDVDFCYFITGQYYAVACFRQIDEEVYLPSQIFVLILPAEGLRSTE